MTVMLSSASRTRPCTHWCQSSSWPLVSTYLLKFIFSASLLWPFKVLCSTILHLVWLCMCTDAIQWILCASVIKDWWFYCLCSVLFPECHWSKAISRWWKSCGSEVCHHAHHVHIPCSFCHRWIWLCGEPVIRRYNGTRLHTRWEGRTREICTGGENVVATLWHFLTQSDGGFYPEPALIPCVSLTLPVYFDTKEKDFFLYFATHHLLILFSFSQVATKTLPFYNDYFSVPYPLPKIDLIAIADFAAGEFFFIFTLSNLRHFHWKL